MSRQMGRLSVHSPDVAYEQKMLWIRQVLELALKEEDLTVLYGDEFSFYRQPLLAPTYSRKRVEPVARMAAGSNTRLRICGAMNVATGELTYVSNSKIGVIVLRRFLIKLRRHYPGRRLVLIWDNWPIHLHEEVLSVASDLDIGLLFLPTYAPWTNPIEKLWRWCKQELLFHHHLSTDWPELKRGVRRWLDQFDQPSSQLLKYVGLLPN